MRILFTTFQLRNREGSELFVRDLSLALRRRGDEAAAFAFVTGPVAREMEEGGVRVASDLRELAGTPFDAIHAQHNVTALWARALFPRVPMVFWSHGPLPDMEQPPSLDLGVARFAAASEEVRERLVSVHGIDPARVEVVRNGVELSRFAPRGEPSSPPKRVLVLSNRFTAREEEAVDGACRILGATWERAGLPANSVADVPAAIAAADLVVTLGRGVVEALACGRNALVYDVHGGDGLVDEGNFDLLRERNFSGRTFRRPFSAEELAEEMRRADPATPSRLRPRIEADHSLDALASRARALYAAAAAEPVPSPGPPAPGALAREMGVVRDQLHALLDLERRLGEERGRSARLLGVVRWMEASRFWRLRNLYVRLKGGDPALPLGDG